MSFDVLDRTQHSSGLDFRRRNTVWLLLLFVLVGFSIAALVSVLAGSKPFGVVVAAFGILVAIPLLAVLIQAIPEGLAKVRVLARNWTWWHPLWFFIFFSMLVFRIRDVSAAREDPLDAYALLRVVPEAIVALTLIIRLILKKPNWLGSLVRGIPGAMAIYCLVCLASTAWSVNASWTAYKSLEFLADVSLLAAIVASADSWFTYQNLLDWTLTFYGLSLVGVWVNLPIWPSEAMDGGRLTGVLPVEASNSVGTSGGVLAVVALCRMMPLFGRARNRAWYMLLFVFGMVSMVMSKTRNSEAAFVFSVALVVLFSRRLQRIAIAGTVVLAPFVVIATLMTDRLWLRAWDLASGFFQRDQSAGAIDSLSGRTAWWSYGIDQLMHHPLTGLGAYAAGRFAVLGKLGVGAAAMMHSDWIEVMIGTSFWGLIPFAAALIAAWWYLARCIRSNAFGPEQRQLALEFFALLGMLTLHSFFNDELSWHCPLLYFAILGYAEFVRVQFKAESRHIQVVRRSPAFATIS